MQASRNIFWPFQVSWAYLLLTDCFSDRFTGEPCVEETYPTWQAVAVAVGFETDHL